MSGPRFKSDSQDFPLRSPQFATTQWSVVVAAADGGHGGAKALNELCRSYWYPVYCYVRSRFSDVNEAQDLTQAFFTHLLENQTISKADQGRGRFRAFLLTALKNFLTNEWDKTQAAKRGGGRALLSLDFESGESKFQCEPAHELTAEKLYERRWVLTLLDQVLQSIRQELEDGGKKAQWTWFKEALTGELTADDYDRAGRALEISPAAAKQTAYRLRKRYRQMFREAVASTIAEPSSLDDELRQLLAVLAD